jgi:hypothetical protein
MKSRTMPCACAWARPWLGANEMRIGERVVTRKAELLRSISTCQSSRLSNVMGSQVRRMRQSPRS